MKKVSNRSIDILTRLLAEENLDIVHDSNATTASWTPLTRQLRLPTYGNQISSTAQTGFSLHETAHATDSPDDTELKRLFAKYGRNLVNVLEDIRIEKIQKKKYPGSKKFFSAAYDELVTEHDFFGTASQKNPFDFSKFNFLDRVNCHFKVGPKAMVPFGPAEQVLVDRMAAIATIADLEEIATILKEIGEKRAEERKNDYEEMSAPSDFENEDDADFDLNEVDPDEDPNAPDSDGEESAESNEDDSEESGDSEAGEGDSEESDDESDEDPEEFGGLGDEPEEAELTDDPNAPEAESVPAEADDFEGGDEDDDSAAGEGDSEETDESDEDGEEGLSGTGSSDEAGETDSDPDSDDSDDSDDGDESGDGDESADAANADFTETDVDFDDDYSETTEKSEKVMEDLARNAGTVARFPKSSTIEDKVQPWKDIEQFVDTMSIDNPQDLHEFRKEIKTLLNKMVSEFNRNAAGTISRRTSYRDTGTLDPMKMIHYKYNENIFKKRKFVRDGKNHGVVLYVDMTISMRCRIRLVMRQVLLMTEFCRKINIPFRVYGWSNTYLPSTSGLYAPAEYTGVLNNHKKFEKVGITELLTSDMPKATYEKFARWAVSSRGMTPGNSTPLISTLYYAMPAIEKFRKEAGIDVMKMMFFSDGSGHTHLADFNSETWIDDQTGTQYSQDEMKESFKASDFSGYDWDLDTDAREEFFIASVLKDRYDVSSVFMFMNGTKSILERANSGMWTKDETKAVKRTLKEGNQVAEFGTNGPYTFIGIKDGYDISSTKFRMNIANGATDNAIKKEFKKASRLKNSSTLFVNIVAKALAEK